MPHVYIKYKYKYIDVCLIHSFNFYDLRLDKGISFNFLGFVICEISKLTKRHLVTESIQTIYARC